MEGELVEWWKSKKALFPLLTEIALDYIWLPVSNADVERSFSVYSTILRDDRQRLTDDNLRSLTFLRFNREVAAE